MKTLSIAAFALLSVTMSVGLSAGEEPAADDSGRRARIVDSKGTATLVVGLHYCYEEELEEGLFISKFDNFFVRCGEALINARLDSLAEVEFTGKVTESGGVRELEARITTRSGTETVASILCHRGAFIKGRVALGEYQLPLDRVKKMVFVSPEDLPGPALRLVLAKTSEAGRSEPFRIVLTGDAPPCVVADGKSTPLKSFTGALPARLTLVAEGAVSFAALWEILGLLAENGVREIVLSP
jgi:hypothetical protein